ncbi:helix-turn-helix domain-containing protein [Streptomyces chumphonensis]|uniref:helix-turn-helix domain-containing protein n=1 Tax=Streptomyces chumphonensis TaxID=1214925 RepID=UPI003D71C50B
MGDHVRTCADCGCRLSVHNDGTRCAVCTRKAGRDAEVAGPHVPPSAWDDPELRAAVHAWDFGRASRLLRAACSLRQEDMAALTGLSQSFLSMLESGSRRLTSLDKVAGFLSGVAAPDALLPQPAREHLDPPRPAARRTPARAADAGRDGGAGGTVDDGHGDGDGVREPGLRHVAARAAAESLRFAEAAALSNVTDASLEHLSAEIARIAKDYVHAPLHTVFADLLATRDRVFALLGGRQPPRLTRDLYFLGGTSCLLLAHATQNLGDQDAAMSQIRTAWLLAEQADHDGLRAWTKGTAALIHEWSPQGRAALEYTRQAARFCPAGESRVRIAAVEARAAARTGNRDRAAAALDALRRAREERPGGDGGLSEFGGILTFPVAKQEYYVGGTYALLGRPAQAERHAAAAISMYENGPEHARSYGDEALARLDIVTARVAAGEIEGASEQFRHIVELPQALRIRQIDHAVDRVVSLLDAPRFARSPAVRHLSEAARSYHGAPATRRKAALG